jgi:hypothetical protein
MTPGSIDYQFQNYTLTRGITKLHLVLPHNFIPTSASTATGAACSGNRRRRPSFPAVGRDPSTPPSSTVTDSAPYLLRAGRETRLLPAGWPEAAPAGCQPPSPCTGREPHLPPVCRMGSNPPKSDRRPTQPSPGPDGAGRPPCSSSDGVGFSNLLLARMAPTARPPCSSPDGANRPNLLLTPMAPAARTATGPEGAGRPPCSSPHDAGRHPCSKAVRPPPVWWDRLEAP